MIDKKVTVRNKGKLGKAVFAAKDIKKGEVVTVFDGNIYDYDYPRWNKELCDHCIQIAQRAWRDSKGAARYINHSCEPNCGIKNLTEVVAMKNIKAGEEINWDYEMTEDSTWWRMRCKCGQPNCRKVIGTYKHLPEELRKKYQGYISDWLIEKYAKKEARIAKK